MARLPGKLRLEFSKAADAKRIAAALDLEIKKDVDPENYVVPRLASAFCAAVTGGAVAFLSDENGAVQSLTAAYRLSANDNPAPDARHDYTEFGSTLSLLQGYKSAQLVIAALALKEWIDHPPQQVIAAEIRPENIASAKTYRDALGWTEVTDEKQHKDLDRLTWGTVPDPADPAGKTGMQAPPASAAGDYWFKLDEASLARQARVVLEAMDRGGLTNKAGHLIPVDFSALAEEGLTKERLETLAASAPAKKAPAPRP